MALPSREDAMMHRQAVIPGTTSLFTPYCLCMISNLPPCIAILDIISAHSAFSFLQEISFLSMYNVFYPFSVEYQPFISCTGNIFCVYTLFFRQGISILCIHVYVPIHVFAVYSARL